MRPRYYSADVYAGSRYLREQTMLVVLDWSPSAADGVRHTLNSLLRSAAEESRATESDLRKYRLEGWLVGDEGLRVTMQASWVWRYQPDTDEAADTIWWRL